MRRTILITLYTTFIYTNTFGQSQKDSVAVYGNVKDSFTHEILKKLGGTLSDNLSHKGIIYGQAYSIMKYNIPRLLRLLDEDGWEISCIKEALDNG